MARKRFYTTLIGCVGIVGLFGISQTMLATSYTFNTVAAASANWQDATKWTPSGFPNAIDDVANFVMPATTAPGANGLTISLAGIDTVGSIVVDNTANPNNFVTRINGTGGQLIFQSSTGTATYTENAGTPNTTNNGRFVINQPTVSLLSNLVVTQDNQTGLNTSTEFGTRVDGASNITITKKGVSNLQFTDDTTNLLAGQGFFGKIDIQAGGIRLAGRELMQTASGITVESGGQLQLGDTSAGITDWNMASGSLTLNGAGKTTGTVAIGALRFNVLSTATPPRSTTFHPPVILQTDSRIDVAVAGSTATLDGVVSGSGGLIVSSNNLTGTLALTNAGDSYAGKTQILSGTLSITHAYLADSNDVYLTTGGTFNLNFGATDIVRSLFIDGTAQATGTWGAVGSGAAHESALITGSGFLNVSTMPVVGVPGDFNNNGVVDAADYVLWRSGGPLQNEVSDSGTVTPQDYLDWRARFGNTSGAGSALGAAAVPEPAVLSMCGLGLFFAGCIGRRERHNGGERIDRA